MKMTRLTIPFAFFMLIGSSAFGYDLSSEARSAIGNLVKSATEKYPEYAQQKQGNQAQPNTNVKLANQCPEHYPLGSPIVISAQKDKIERRSFYLCRTGYSVQFDPATKTPLWSAEKLSGNTLMGAKEPRTDDFQTDPHVPYPAQAKLADYKGSGFDRGHMTPAADQSGRGGNAMSETFYLTNMVPQVGPNQNRGIWADLESDVRDWAKERGEVLVVTGPIYDNGAISVGGSNVWIPTRLYKVVLDPKRMESIAFIIPNQQIITRKTRIVNGIPNLDKGNPNFPQTLPSAAVACNQSICNVMNFAVPVSAVEQVTGLRFFSRLNAVDHQRVTQSVATTFRIR